jgi:hypothetical protein
MILFQDIIEILHGTVFRVLAKNTVDFELSDVRRISSVLVGIDTRGAGWFSPPDALARKRSAAATSRLADRRKSIVAPVESTARY